jgi:glycosyltransferase involved in cell wall biosynthesis
VIPLSKENTLVIVPAFNEAISIEGVIQDLLSQEFLVLVISDGSNDGTANVSRSAGVKVLELPINLGVGGALRAGFRFAVAESYQAVVQVDADGQHPPEEIVELLIAANTGQAHMVIGSRFRSNGTSMKVGAVRRLVMRFLAWSASKATGSEITDATSGFRIIREPLLGKYSQSFPTNYLGDTYEAIVSAGRAGYVVNEIPAAIRERVAGESSASVTQAVKFTVKSLAVVFLRLHRRI